MKTDYRGKIVVLRTKDAIFQPCTIVKCGTVNVTVSYCKGLALDKQTGKMVADTAVEIVPRKDIVSMTERVR